MIALTPDLDIDLTSDVVCGWPPGCSQLVAWIYVCACGSSAQAGVCAEHRDAITALVLAIEAEDGAMTCRDCGGVEWEWRAM